MFKGIVLGSLIATAICVASFIKFTEDDIQLMTEAHELLNKQQELILDIQANCDNRNWIAFDDEVYVCMPVNQMFHQLSQPPIPTFKFPDENEA